MEFAAICLIIGAAYGGILRGYIVAVCGGLMAIQQTVRNGSLLFLCKSWVSLEESKIFTWRISNEEFGQRRISREEIWLQEFWRPRVGLEAVLANELKWLRMSSNGFEWIRLNSEASLQVQAFEFGTQHTFSRREEKICERLWFLELN